MILTRLLVRSIIGRSQRFGSHTPIRYYSASAVVRQQNVQALIGYAFQGKPRLPAQSGQGEQGQDADEGELSKQAPRQGFPPDTPIGRWVDETLSGGDSGEDAVAVSPMKAEGDWLLAVADGVGGWSENGIDPALFSQSLIYHAVQRARNFDACPERIDDTLEKEVKAVINESPAGSPIDILKHAYSATLKEKGVTAGSATASILTFDASKGVLRAANLGDSGYLILRPASGATKPAEQSQGQEIDDATEDVGMHAIHHQSKPQTHGFNTPFQLSKLPPEYRIDGSIDSQPRNADQFTCQLLDGDVVLLATDGFWDNVSTSEILQMLTFIRQKHRTAWVEHLKKGDIKHHSLDHLAEERDLANAIAVNLLQYALICQFSTEKTSPFEREAKRHGIHYPGGKVDDVALICALIAER